MNEKYLLEGERIIRQSDGNIITLTNMRLRYMDTSRSQGHAASIFLKNISSIELRYGGKTIFLVLAPVFFLGCLGLGLAQEQAVSMAIIGIIAGAISVFLYYKSINHFLTIYSTGEGKISFHTKGMKTDTVEDFINKIEDEMRKF